MSTEIYEFPFDVFQPPAWAFAALAQRGASHRVTATTKKIEGEGTTSDNAATEPSTWSLQGRVSSQQQDLAGAQKKAEELVKKKAIVLVLSGNVLAEYCLITSANITQSVEDGDTLVAAFELQEMRVRRAGSAQIPPSRLRQKVKRKAATPAKGGASKPKTATDNRGNILKLGERLKGGRIG